MLCIEPYSAQSTPASADRANGMHGGARQDTPKQGGLIYLAGDGQAAQGVRPTAGRDGDCLAGGCRAASCTSRDVRDRSCRSLPPLGGSGLCACQRAGASRLCALS